MISAVDTNVLLDVLIEDAPRGDESEEMLASAQEAGAVVISEMVYSELGARFNNPADLDDFLTATHIRLERMQKQALYAAGQAWRGYARRRPSSLECPQCGEKQQVACQHCGASLSRRQRMLADFVIGAHALTQADQLLTRDRGFYATYFPKLSLRGNRDG